MGKENIAYKWHIFFRYCSSPNIAMTFSYSEDAQGVILSTNNLSSTTLKSMEIYTKDSIQTPLDTMKAIWFSKLTPEQQNNCSIQDADRPVDPKNYYEKAHPTPHKTRYEIAVKPDVIKSIIAASGDVLPTNSKYDYLCGSVVGSPFESPAENKIRWNL
jgi:hypothetical protein